MDYTNICVICLKDKNSDFERSVERILVDYCKREFRNKTKSLDLLVQSDTMPPDNDNSQSGNISVNVCSCPVLQFCFCSSERLAQLIKGTIHQTLLKESGESQNETIDRALIKKNEGTQSDISNVNNSASASNCMDNRNTDGATIDLLNCSPSEDNRDYNKLCTIHWDAIVLTSPRATQSLIDALTLYAEYTNSSQCSARSDSTHTSDTKTSDMSDCAKTFFMGLVSKTRIYAVGAATARGLHETYGYQCFGCDTGNATALSQRILDDFDGLENAKMLFLCGKKRMKTLPERLRAANHFVCECIVYQSEAADPIEIETTLEEKMKPFSHCWVSEDMDTTHTRTSDVTIPLRTLYVPIFFSPSSVEAIVGKLANKELKHSKLGACKHLGESKCIGAIGPTTGTVLQKYVSVDYIATAKSPTPEGIANAICLRIKTLGGDVEPNA